MSVDKTKELTKRAIGKCTPNADRLSNAIKSLIDKVMRGQLFENASALGILQFLLCSEDLKTLIAQIPPWGYDGTGTGNTDVTPEQEHFYDRITSVGGNDLLDKLRTLQYGPEAAFGTQTTLTDTMTSQQSSMNSFKDHTDQQSGVGDPTTFMRTMGVANGYDSAKQQMEGKDQDNFTGFFNSTIQGPVIIGQMQNILCSPDSLGQLLRTILDLIAGILPFSLDDITGLLGMGIDAFFDELDQLFSQLAGFFEYLNYLVSLDLSQFSLGQVYIQKFTLGQFLASIARGDGRGNCIMRAMLEEFTGSDNMRDAITAVQIEKDKEEKAAAAAAASSSESGKERANAQKNTDKEIFFEPVPDELILQGVITGTPTPTPPALDEVTAREIVNKLLELDQRTMEVGYRIAMIVTPTLEEGILDGGYFDENSSGGSDTVVPVDSEWASPSPTPTVTPSPSPSVGLTVAPEPELGGGGFGYE